MRAVGHGPGRRWAKGEREKVGHATVPAGETKERTSKGLACRKKKKKRAGWKNALASRMAGGGEKRAHLRKKHYVNWRTTRTNTIKAGGTIIELVTKWTPLQFEETNIRGSYSSLLGAPCWKFRTQQENGEGKKAAAPVVPAGR